MLAGEKPFVKLNGGLLHRHGQHMLLPAYMILPKLGKMRE